MFETPIHEENLWEMSSVVFLSVVPAIRVAFVQSHGNIYIVSLSVREFESIFSPAPKGSRGLMIHMFQVYFVCSFSIQNKC